MMSERFKLEAACRPSEGVDPEIFFPVADPDTDLYDRQVGKAKSICRTCPVQNECLRWSIVTGQWFGVWGGYDETERRAMLLRPRAARIS
jgi:WhiB family redox-sensing transcriptional regulator